MALHQALQASFGWSNAHCFDFIVKDPNADHEPPDDMVGMIERLRLIHTNPEGPSSVPRLNHLRIVPWKAGQRFGNGDWGVDAAQNQDRFHTSTPEKQAGKTKLWNVLGDPKWDHVIELIGREPPTASFSCKERGGHGVAEDVGSSSGLNKLLAAYRSNRPNSEQKDKIKWFESMCSNADKDGLKGRESMWDIASVNEALQKINISEQRGSPNPVCNTFPGNWGGRS
ncbi:Uu.00g010110.m01.CDS01 [Anthostomella pinea]|uniref:Uu.00g010110.m01.CDS01 n=1 Tax=Anthostomella pinea TaxID=933095 RepID=A0AAI8VXH9_9PEZI|nr:Uu.00g010110.m01.CDS01 [Anthostomella pinea]